MSYLAKVLQPGEQVVHLGRQHWIIYLPAIIILCIALAVLAVPSASDNRVIIYTISGLLVLIAVERVSIMVQTVHHENRGDGSQDHLQTGLFSRHTAEMNMHRVETVAVEQGIMGRLLNYGTVHIRGTGAGLS